MALTKDQIEKLNGISDDEKSELLSLFNEASESRSEVERLRKSQPKDSQEIVDKQEYKNLQAAMKKSEDKNSELENKLKELQMRTPEGEDITADDALVMFAPVIDLICGSNDQ